MKSTLFGAIACAIVVTGGLAGDKDVAAMQSLLVNTPAASTWNVWGAHGAVISNAKVTGGQAMHIDVDKGAHPWDGGASTPITKPVHKGDVILASFWARAASPASGGKTARIAAIAMQLTQAPYTTLFSESAEVGGDWAMYYASGTVDHDYSAGDLNLTLQLAAANQTIELGPAFIVNLGSSYDAAKLPHN